MAAQSTRMNLVLTQPLEDTLREKAQQVGTSMASLVCLAIATFKEPVKPMRKPQTPHNIKELVITIPLHLKTRIQDIAKRHKLNTSELIRIALKDYLATL